MLQSNTSEWWTLDITFLFFFFFLILSFLYFVFFFSLFYFEYPLKRLQNSRDRKISTYQFVLSSYRWCFLINCPNPGGWSRKFGYSFTTSIVVKSIYRVSKKKRFVFFFFFFPSLFKITSRKIYIRVCIIYNSHRPMSRTSSI